MYSWNFQQTTWHLWRFVLCWGLPFFIVAPKNCHHFCKKLTRYSRGHRVTAAIFYHKTILIDMHHRQEYEERIESRIHLYWCAQLAWIWREVDGYEERIEFMVLLPSHIAGFRIRSKYWANPSTSFHENLKYYPPSVILLQLFSIFDSFLP